MLNFDRIARAYGVRDLIDYYGNANDPHPYERGSGLLVASGAGVMLAVMDACPEFRWCLDIDANREARLGGLLAWATRYCSPPIGIAGWFSITSPAPLQAALAEAIEQTRGNIAAICYAAPDIVLNDLLPHPRTLADFKLLVSLAATDATERLYAWQAADLSRQHCES